MDREYIIAKLKAVEPQLRAHRVAALYLFGSYARNEARQDPDVDVFVDPSAEDFYSLKHFVAAYEIIQNAIPGFEVAMARAPGCPNTSGRMPSRKPFAFSYGRQQIALDAPCGPYGAETYELLKAARSRLPYC